MICIGMQPYVKQVPKLLVQQFQIKLQSECPPNACQKAHVANFWHHAGSGSVASLPLKHKKHTEVPLKQHADDIRWIQKFYKNFIHAEQNVTILPAT